MIDCTETKIDSEDIVVLDDGVVLESACVDLTINNLGSANWVIGEVPLGAINGINATFTAFNTFVPSSLAVYLNGLRQRIVDDYQVSGNAITFLVSPLPNEHLSIDYQRG